MNVRVDLGLAEFLREFDDRVVSLVGREPRALSLGGFGDEGALRERELPRVYWEVGRVEFCDGGNDNSLCFEWLYGGVVGGEGVDSNASVACAVGHPGGPLLA